MKKKLCRRNPAGRAFLIKYVHTEEGQQSLSAVIFQAAFIGDFLHKDTVGRHAGILKLRERTGLAQLLFAGTAQGAAAGTHQKAMMPLLPQPLRQTDLACVVAALALLQSGGSGQIRNLPESQ